MSTVSAREGFVDVPGGRVWYQILGSANAIPLLTLHGGPGYPHDYLEPLESLIADRPVVFYDQLGCGKSERPDDSRLWHIDRFVDELAEIRQALGLRRLHLFGHSWGAMLAADYALTNPPGLVSLILASPPLSIPRWLADARALRKGLPAEVQSVLDQHEAAGTIHSDEYQAAAREFYRRHVYRMDPLPEAIERMRNGANRAIYNTMWGPTEFFMTGNLVDYDRSTRLHEITLPTLLTCGRYDEATPGAVRWYQRLLPDAELAVFKESAHIPHLSETARYLSVLRDFLSRAEPREPLS